MIDKFSSAFKDYLRVEGPKHFKRQLKREELDAIYSLQVKSSDRGFNIEVEDIGKEFSEFVTSSIDANSIALFYGGKY